MNAFNFNKTIYSICDYSGEWSKPYREAGYDVHQIDLKYGHDARLLTVPDNPVHGVLMAPMCTVFAGCGAKWRALRPTSEVLEGLSLVDACLRFVYALKSKYGDKLVFWCMENPKGWLPDYIGPYRYKFDPCDYGDPYTKETWLWGEFNIPEKNRVEPTEGSKMHLKYGGRSGRTKTLRSITPPGFSQAFFKANQ